MCFLVMDSHLLAEAGGDVLLMKIPSPHKSLQLTFGPGMFAHIDEGSPLDCGQPPAGVSQGGDRASGRRRLLPAMWDRLLVGE